MSDKILVTVEEPKGEFIASAEESPVVPAQKPVKEGDRLADLVEENKKLKEELEEMVGLCKKLELEVFEKR